MRHLLVVAHQTLDSPLLIEAMREETEAGPCRFHLIVPVRHDSHRGVWTEAEVRATASQHLDAALERFDAEGLTATGEVGDASPVTAVGDVLVREGRDTYDAVLMSTLPHAFSRWLKVDAPARIERNFGLPVRHVVAHTATLG